MVAWLEAAEVHRASLSQSPMTDTFGWVCNWINELSTATSATMEAKFFQVPGTENPAGGDGEAAQRKRQSILRVEYQWIMRGAQARRTKNK